MPAFGIVNEHFDGSIEDTCALLSDLGYDGVEITPWTVTDDVPDPSPSVSERVRSAATNAGIDIIGVPRVFSAADTDYHIGHPDDAVRRRTLDYLRATVRFCWTLGGEVVLFGSPNQRTVGPDRDYGAVWTRAVETLSNPGLLDDLSARDVTLCMEPLSPPHTDFITTAADAVAFVDAIDHPNVRVVLDTFHLASETDPPAKVIERTAPYLSHVHADNTSGLGPATGTVDLEPIAAALDRIGYDGYVSVELHADVLGEGVEGDPPTIAAESIDFLRATFG